MSSLSLLAEILGSMRLPATVELIAALLDTLNKVVHDAPTGTGDKVFVEQVLMSALENVALNMPVRVIFREMTASLSHITLQENFSMPANVRLDILVELVRGTYLPFSSFCRFSHLVLVSESPQTFNQALLLTATLARLAPNAILHNIMPIFTFMGSNVFHRDDSYSFRVVQKVDVISHIPQ